MTKFILAGLTIILLSNLNNVIAGIYRHDVPFEKFKELASQKQFECVGLLKKDEKDVGGAVVISKEWAVTAAHVFESNDVKGLTLEVSGQTFQLTKILIHPDYARTDNLRIDLALIKLDKKYKGNFARLYQGKEETGLVGTIVGFGFVRDSFNPNANKNGKVAGQNLIDAVGSGLPTDFWAKKSFGDNLLVVDFDSPTDLLINSLGDKAPLPLEYIVDGGDSGGGLFVQIKGKWHLAGINVRSVHNLERLKSSFAKYGFYGSACGFSRVSIYKEWIEKSQKN